MKLSDLLDELRSNMLNDRNTSTGDDDRLWSDATLVRYINEAQRRFAVRSYCIRDASTPEVVDVTLVAGTTEYTLHPSILGVISAKVDGASADLGRVGHTLLDVRNDQQLCYAWQFDQLSPGAPLAIATDEALGEDDDGNLSAVIMRVYPTPRTEDAGTVIKLRVVRRPLDELTTSSMSAVPEIPEDHHLEMLCWAAHLALRIADEDAGNISLSDKYAAQFESYVQDARKLVLRKLAAPQTWGFGRNGWGGYCRDG